MNIATKLNIDEIKTKFIGLNSLVRNKPLVYLDSGATTLKLKSVVDEVVNYYSASANIHRGTHFLAIKATEEFEATRDLVKTFVGARKKEEIIFTKGTTEAINLVATILRDEIKKGDEIIISALEHHSNMVPWQMLAKEKEATIKIAPINPDGEIIIEDFSKLLNEKTKIVAINHISNSIGTVNDIARIVALAKKVGALTLIDGAQAIAHKKVNVLDLGCDFYCFSGHKMFGPTGVGVLYGKEELLERLPPYQGGGEMIKDVTYQGSTYNDLPYKFEAGTPNIAGVIGLKKSIEFINDTGLTQIANYESMLLKEATSRLKKIPNLTIIGNAKDKGPILSFNIKGLHHDDIGTLLDQQGIAVRTGHHCCSPLMNLYKIPGTIRATFSIYNTLDDIEKLSQGIVKAVELL